VIELKSANELQTMERANHLVLTVLGELADLARPGVTTADLDRHAERRILESDARPAFKGYRGYPCSLCTSLNDEVVHGIPSDRRILKDGDILAMDLGTVVDGYYGDSAITVAIGNVDETALRLMEVTEQSLAKGIEAARTGARVGDISHAVQHHVESHGMSIVRDFVGHGIGRALHEDPQVPNFGQPGQGERLREGMVLAIEPMVTTGEWRIKVGEDGWTATTADGSLSAHFERSVAITKNGPHILGIDGVGQ
jgi:methionyl aminopeptidase